MSRKPSKPETRIEDYLDVMTGGNAALPQPILRIEFYYAFLAGMAVELPQPILDDEKLLAKICGMEVEAPTYIPGISPRLYAYMAKKGGQDVQVPDPILRLECYWYDYSAGSPPSVQEYTGAVPVTFIADGTPLLDLMISGNEEHSGTPTPDDPITPEGTGERTENLLPSPVAAIKSNNGITVRSDGAGRYYVSGTAENDAYITFNIQPFLIPKSAATGGNGTFSMFNTKTYLNDTVKLEFYYQGTFIDNWLLINLNRTSTNYSAMANKTIDTVGFSVKSGSTVDFQIFPEFTNNGVLPTNYEPYGYKIPISSADTTTPVYLGEVQTTRKVKELVLTGEESLVNAGGNAPYRLPINDIAISSSTTSIEWYCSHYQSVSTDDSWASYDYCISRASTTTQSLQFRDVTKGDITAFKQYLAAQYAAGTPVTVWYVLETEETAIVNEPLMKIGDYADTVSMEQAGVSIPTANGSTTLDVETTVPPSEIYIKYRGEAVATLSMLSAEVSSPEETPEEVNPEETEETENER